MESEALTPKQIAEDPMQRAFMGAAITVMSGEDGEYEAAVVDVAQSVTAEVSSHETGVGWGGDTHAITVVLDGIDYLGGVGGGLAIGWVAAKKSASVISSVWSAIRRTPGVPAPDLSLGAVAYLCMADLHELLGGQTDDVVLFQAIEVSHVAQSAWGFSGSGEPYLLLFASPERSWLYLATSKGHMIHRSEGTALPNSNQWGVDYYTQGIEPSPMRFLGEEPPGES